MKPRKPASKSKHAEEFCDYLWTRCYPSSMPSTARGAAARALVGKSFEAAARGCHAARACRKGYEHVMASLDRGTTMSVPARSRRARSGDARPDR